MTQGALEFYPATYPVISRTPDIKQGVGNKNYIKIIFKIYILSALK
jgi:hypothetical protein